MGINTRQFDQLTEMGIPLWQSRFKSNPAVNNQISASYQDVDLTLLAKNRCFTDILLAIELSIGEIKKQKKGLDLGLFNWLFLTDDVTSPENNTQGPLEITYHDNQLVTPNITLIAQSPQLKKALWHVLTNDIL